MQPFLKRFFPSIFISKLLKVFGFLIARVHLLLLPLLILFYFEYLARDSVEAMFTWSWEQPMPFRLNYIIVLALFLLFISICGRTWMAYLALAAIMTIIGFVTGVKLKFLGVPLMPWDVLLSKETEAISTYLTGIWDWILLSWSFGFIAISYLLIRWVPRFNIKIKWPEKIILLGISCCILFSVYGENPLDLKNNFHIFNVTWDQGQNYRLNGFLVATTLNLKLAFVPKPVDYTEAHMKELIQSVPRRTNIDQTVKPNIIVILSESLFDPTLLPKVKFEKDPMPFMRDLMKNYSSGLMLSPQFGGGTANVEFEVLTGNSMRFTPPGSTPYIQYANHGIDSLASILTRQGYEATAISPFFNWFYNSKNVYKNFGFSHYISLEFFEQHFKGHEIADVEVTKNIIAQTEKSAGPDFIFANTMENHQPYDADKFYTNPIKVTGDISKKGLGMLTSYTTGVVDADLMLKTLVEYYTVKKEPTILVFFGDHKPVLGSNYGVYTETGYFKPNDTGRLRKEFDVPLVVWNNYLPKHKDELDISPAFLGSYVLNLAEKEGTAYTDYLYNFSQKIPIIPPSFYYEGFHIEQNELNPYKLFQYDMMFGKQYVLKDYPQPIVNPTFKLGYDKMVIDSLDPKQVTAGVAFQTVGDESIITISGRNFVEKCEVYANGKPLDTRLQGDGKLKVYIPQKLIDKPGEITFVVKVLDSQGIVVADSEPFKLKVAKG
ncbi:LTA synthase family protein [Paenibacillus psychroresistens]|uniref:LTA synthase family protein n=1 Tax=Paenibacillus psychroresistens TaxID=1778678 RepID=A0A6B8RNU1_9BACL|nr:LTA synthase family protein [Paenibacillus psychroresistens]QGQ97382.1 LTA synthase family protein [Paenibacillus psychroresistens]